MKTLFTNWDFNRLLYLIAGIWMIAQSVMDKMWFLVPIGLYFIIISILKISCASGNCHIPYQKETNSEN